ncbi:hypothetical protein J113_01440 [Mycobacterium tuberculosis CAS/NITR204]|uniref:Haemophore haem-binding domain-containing protein n=1 Tax=Mycobacterium tuberculosis CAS/NITR204 TaxID=1310114 RepID=R4MCK5_MYCTX|nr:hypothetical protein J113_01440 [Mycobacterium tuberculosis CAS/NITR204]
MLIALALPGAAVALLAEGFTRRVGPVRGQRSGEDGRFGRQVDGRLPGFTPRDQPGDDRGLQQQVGPGSVASLKAHFEANPKVASDLHALSQPLTDLSTRCSLPISGLQAIGLMQAVQGARR